MRPLFLLSISLLIVACNGSSEETSPEDTNAVDQYQPLPYIGFHDVDFATGDSIYHSVGSWQLMNQDSTVITNDSLNGVVHVANFFFTSCPSICPAMIEQMKRLQEMTAEVEELVFLSHTIDPERDSIPKLRQYIKDRKIDTHNWHFLYGEREYIHTLGKEDYMVNAMEDEEADGGFLHSEHFVLIDRDGHIRGLYTGTVTEEVDRLAEDIKLLIEHEYGN